MLLEETLSRGMFPLKQLLAEYYDIFSLEEGQRGETD